MPTMERLKNYANLTRKPLSWFLIEDATRALRAATAELPDDVVNNILSLPQPLQALVERYLERAARYSATLPPWMGETKVPDDPQSRKQMLDEIEADIARRIGDLQ